MSHEALLYSIIHIIHRICISNIGMFMMKFSYDIAEGHSSHQSIRKISVTRITNLQVSNYTDQLIDI